MKKVVYLCDLCPPNDDGEQPELVGMMHTVKLTTNSQGMEKSVDVDACEACKKRFFPITS